MDFKELEVRINYKFKNLDVLQECLTHPSMNLEHKNYERLEFLGDAVLNFIITEFLVKEYQTHDEGELAKKRSFLVSGNLISKIAKAIDLGAFIIMSNSERKSGGAENLANLENAAESLIGSIYIDGGIEAAKDFIMSFWQDYLLLEISGKDYNPKSYLQEWSLSKGYSLPIYKLKSQSGAAHDPLFEIEVLIDGFSAAIGYGRNKKEAEIIAARNLIKELE